MYAFETGVERFNTHAIFHDDSFRNASNVKVFSSIS
jgi:hypothetical protein